MPTSEDGRSKRPRLPNYYSGKAMTALLGSLVEQSPRINIGKTRKCAEPELATWFPPVRQTLSISRDLQNLWTDLVRVAGKSERRNMHAIPPPHNKSARTELTTHEQTKLP